MSSTFLPFARPSIGEDEIDAVVDALRSGWWTSGPRTQQFEQDFAQFVGSEHAVAVNSATAGLHLALEAIGIGESDKVLTTPYTFTATAEVIRYLGADPIFVDIEADGFNMDVTKITALLAQHPDIKAIMPVHFAGQPCEMDTILSLAEQHNLMVIEDAAHTLPARYKGKQVGTLGDFTVFSFYVTKPIATGEGGMVTTRHAQYAQRIRTMRLHGINRDAYDRESDSKPSWYYEVIAPGYKYNMTDMAAALGIHQLKKADALCQRRTDIAAQYDQALQNLPVTLPRLLDDQNQHSWHLYVLQLHLENLTINRDVFIEQLQAAGIGTSVHFIPLHIQPYWQQRYQFAPDDFPVALRVYQRAVSLPIYPSMSDTDVQRVCTAVRDILDAAQQDSLKITC